MRRTTLTVVALALLLPGRADAQAQPAEPESGPTTKPSTLKDPETLLRALETLRRQQHALRRRLETLENDQQSRELKALRRQAEREAAKSPQAAKQGDAQKNLQGRSFGSAQRALQALNPELSVVVDLLGKGLVRKNGYIGSDDRSGFLLRQFGIHFQSMLDPFSLVKATLEISPEGVELEEAFITWVGLLPGVTLTAGRFRQQLGVVNRYHQESLDQVDYPLALQTLFGAEGLAQTGVSVQWLLPPLWAHANALLLQVTNGENERVFSGALYSLPAVLLRLTSYYDLSSATYVELGLTAVVGWNHQLGAKDAASKSVHEDRRNSWIWAADWTLRWEPRRTAKYKNVLLQGEFYGVRKNVPGEDLVAWGLFQTIQAKLSRRWELGIRFDWSMVLDADQSRDVWGANPYLVWWQSEWVRARLQYAFSRNFVAVGNDHRVLLQITFAAGPHKHERY